jgi:hypothetical protein
MRRSALRRAIEALVEAVDVSGYQRAAGKAETLRHAKLAGDTGFQFDHLTFTVELGDTVTTERKRSEVMATTSVTVTCSVANRRALDGSVWSQADLGSDLAEDIAGALSVSITDATLRVDAIRTLGPTSDDVAWGYAVDITAIHSTELGA